MRMSWSVIHTQHTRARERRARSRAGVRKGRAGAGLVDRSNSGPEYSGPESLRPRPREHELRSGLPSSERHSAPVSGDWVARSTPGSLRGHSGVTPDSTLLAYSGV